MTDPISNERLAVTREDAISFLEGACRNWSHVPELTEEDIGDVSMELLRFVASRRQSPAGVEVKPLEWRVPTDRPDEMDDSAILIADGLGGHYAISHPQKVGPKFLLWWAHDPFHWTGHETPEAAKAAAQADYERRVLSSLSVKEPHNG